MAAPVASFEQLPDDSANTGKKVRTQTQVIGGNTVHSQFVVRQRRANVLGVYRISMSQIAIVVSAQNGTTTGALWMHMPSAVNAKSFRVRQVQTMVQYGTASNVIVATAPRLAITRFTYDGVCSGATLTAGKVDSSFSAHSTQLATASTGLTVALGAVVGVSPQLSVMTIVSSPPGTTTPCHLLGVGPQAPHEDFWPIFKAGEGLVIYQDVAGTASDARWVNLTIIFDEIDTA